MRDVAVMDDIASFPSFFFETRWASKDAVCVFLPLCVFVFVCV